jgi:internalin A
MNKRIISLILITIISLSVLGYTVSGCGSADRIITDPGLAKVIKETLGKKMNEGLTIDDLAELTRLDALHREIDDLSGIEHCVNLEALYLGGFGEIIYAQVGDDDISLLASLSKLEILYIDSAVISDISPLASLTELRILILESNYISDISTLASLTNLTEINLCANSISDISPLASLSKLTKLDISYNDINDISPLTNLEKLRTLNIKRNPIIDTSQFDLLPEGCVINFK